jgi:hypothetical protein
MGLDEGPTFIRDYYTHMWKEAPQVVEGRMAMARQGSGRNLKARSIPTLQEGIDAGLTPVDREPDRSDDDVRRQHVALPRDGRRAGGDGRQRHDVLGAAGARRRAGFR